ncbi:MAG: hypothetical protein H8D96_13550 [Desulfobacterales bacterium]|uniref:Tagatose-6-phosphate kinase n=1 Tax=Candidatus Desulfatibia vada TaxID=2841696 RepID=A0A8J6P5Z2_9BACT|nr:hypothetical protein [Candidatus Desulfatibia vada]
MLKNFIKKRRCTQLCVGPMSKNCIDVSIEISKQLDIPIVLIASRRQIDADFLGGGYVEPFTTQAFSDYVKSKKANKVFMARDHGGPWQNNVETSQNMDLETAMESAKRSFEIDILSGLQLIHIDPSIPIQNENLDLIKILDRLFELYSFCVEVADKHSRKIEVELGTEEQNGYGQNFDMFEFFVSKTIEFCARNGVPKPAFVVAQTGTKVKEMKNVGTFQNNISEEKKLPLYHLERTLEVCNRHGIMMKEHNTDYLSNQALALRPLLGIHASNVAPEFGVAETKSFLYLLKTHGHQKAFDRFVEIALESKKWEKWMLEETTSSDLEKAIISGHYIFSHPEVIEMKNKTDRDLTAKNIDLEGYLQQNIKASMMRYVQLFNMI